MPKPLWLQACAGSTAQGRLAAELTAGTAPAHLVLALDEHAVPELAAGVAHVEGPLHQVLQAGRGQGQKGLVAEWTALP